MSDSEHDWLRPEEEHETETVIDAGTAQSNPEVADAVAKIAALRQSIDNVDTAIVSLLAERFKYTSQVLSLIHILYKEYRDVIKLFTYVVETERRFYLANKVDFNVRSAGQDVYFDVRLTDAWVWDVYRSSRFVKNVRIVTFKDVNVEEVQKTDIDIPDSI